MGLIGLQKGIGMHLRTLIKNEKIINLDIGCVSQGISIGRFLWLSRAHNRIDPYSHIVVLTRLYIGYV